MALPGRLILAFLLSVTVGFGQQPANVLSDYLKINSVSGHEKAAGLYLEQLCRSMGLYTTVFSNGDSSYNFCASLLPLNSGKPSVLLLNHIDVVPAAEDSSWLAPPFGGLVKSDTLYGRGALDMKGPAIMQLFALKKVKELANTDSCHYNIVFLCVSGEETGGRNGAANMISPQLLALLRPAVVFGEGGGGLTNVVPGKPTELCFFVSTAEKKSLWIRLEARVKTRGHGSAAGSRTANKLLLRAINKIENTEQRILIDASTRQTFRELGQLMGGYKGFVLKHFDWWVFKPLRRRIVRQNEGLMTLVSNSYQLTRVENSQGPVNQVAQSAAAYYDCRLLPGRSERPFFMKLLFRILDPRIRITVLDESPEAEATKPDAHYGHLKAALLAGFPQAHVIPVLFPATTDNSYFRSVGVPTYGVLPFRLSEAMVESVHAGNERLPLSAIDDGIGIYTVLLKNYVQLK